MNAATAALVHQLAPGGWNADLLWLVNQTERGQQQQVANTGKESAGRALLFHALFRSDGIVHNEWRAAGWLFTEEGGKTRRMMRVHEAELEHGNGMWMNE